VIVPSCFRPCQLCCQPESCSHCQKHAVQCSGSSSVCLHDSGVRKYCAIRNTCHKKGINEWM